MSVFDFIRRKSAEQQEVGDYLSGNRRRLPSVWQRALEEREDREIAESFDVKKELEAACKARADAGLK